MNFKLSTESDRNRLIGYLTGLDLTKPKSVTVADEKRSDAQNRRLWAMLRDVSKQVEWYGQKLSDEDFKHIFSASVEKQRAVPGLDGGFVVMGISTRKQSKAWFAEMFLVIEAFGAERGVRFSTQDVWGIGD